MKITKHLITCTLLVLNHFMALAQVVAEFTADKTEGCPPSLAVTFNNKSTGATSYSWSFGNGNSSNDPNPQALYSAPGSYLVTLTASNGAITSTKSVLIKVFNPPVAEFSAAKTGCTPFTTQFVDQSTKGDADITGWLWDFRNGVTSTQKSPQVTYNDQGEYSILLTVTDNNGCKNTLEKVKYIDVANKPSVSFTTSPASACKVPATINFTNNSTGKGTLTYEWTFGNGTIGTSRSPIAIYDNFGSYNVSLKVTTSYGCSNSLTVPAVNVTKITAVGELKQTSRVLATTDFACAGEVSFTNKSTGNNSCYWLFGDGGYSYETNPVHTYTQAGTFTVKLIASPGNQCADTAKWNITIEKPNANFSYTPTAACYDPITVNYTNLSTNANTYQWTFYDNSTKTELNPSFTYTMKPDKDPYVVHATSSFPVTLKATSLHGCVSTITKSFAITKPTAILSADIAEGCVPLTVNFAESSQSKEEPITLRKWIFGDGLDVTTSSQNTTQHIYSTPGTYNAKLVVSTVNCRDTSFNVVIKVGQIPEPDFQITSATPFYSSQPVTINNTTPAMYNIDYWRYSINGENVTSCPNSSNVSYKYKSDIGTLPVTLTVGSNGCYKSKTINNAIEALGPIGSFTYNIDCATPLVYSFTGTQKGATSYKWDFGDASPEATILSPSHTYSSAGDYLVKFITFNNGYTDTASQKIYVRQPNALFTTSTQVCANNSVKMDGNASHPIFTSCRDKYVWDFGDGSPKIASGIDSIRHTFTKRGTYNVVLKALYENGCSSSLTKAITVFQPYGLLEADKTKGCTGLSVNFTDKSTADTHPLSGITWNYADGTATETSAPGATKQHSYTLPLGQYAYTFPASITVKDNFGCENIATLDVGISTPFADFVSTGLTSICSSDSIKFIRSYPDPDSAIWNMGDGHIVRSNKNPFGYKYSTAGSYGVSLKIYKYNCSALLQMQPGYITIQKADAHFATADSVYDCPINIAFDHNAVMSPVDTGRWYFGDGYTGSYLKNPMHTYKESGKYRIKLRIHTSFGCVDTFSKVINIKGPTGNFTASKARACKGEDVIFTLKDTMNVKSFEWDMSEGVFKQGNPATYKFKTTGTKNVGLMLYGKRVDCPFVITKPFFVDTVIAKIGIQDTLICEKIDVQFLNKSIGYNTFNWNLGNDSVPSGDDPTTSYLPGNYKVKLNIANSNNCKDSAVKTMVVRPSPTLAANNDTFICVGRNVPLHAITNGDSLAWNPNKWVSDFHSLSPLSTPDSSIQYKVRSFFKATGCLTEEPVNITVQQKINFKLTPHRDTSVVIGEKILLLIEPSETYNYLW
jgi:PKD repeat protein